jgi:hypothetical protein
MDIMNNKFFQNFIVALFCLLLTGCGGAAKDKNKKELPADVPPQAVAEVLGAAVSNGVITVRSGSDVLLTGQNSKGFDDPILQYQWEQIDTTDIKVEFYERATNSIVFKAPNIPLSDSKGINLKFRLTITDADGVKALSEVELLVQPIKDANHFLAVPSVDNKVLVYISAAKDETLLNDVAVVLNVKGIATWQGRDGNTHQATIMSESFSGVVPAGKVESVNDSNNLSFSVSLPELNMDEINKQFKAASRMARLEFEHLQNAQMQLSFELQQATATSLNVYLADTANNKILSVSAAKQVSAFGASPAVKLQKPILTGSGAPVLVDVEELRQALNLESKLSAKNYYKCIDPLEKATTFADWLVSAGFTGKNDGDVNTKYVNNYDLGFGRDMHIRKDANGNVYSYVTNYNTLENTLHNRNEFAIVVMEYSPAPTGNCGDAPDVTAPDSAKKIVKFFAYIPDVKSGGYIRAESMNFDGRGEKYLPGVCTACHYGNNHTKEFNTLGAIAATNADLDSSFMPWDLDAFLYTNASKPSLIEPAYAAFAKSTGLVGGELDKYSREAQEGLFRQQNEMVLHTFTDNPNNIPRFAHAITQLQGWYGNASERAKVESLNFGGDTRNLSDPELQELQRSLKSLPAGKFDGGYVPKGWRGNAAQENLYTSVYDRNCRMCHLFTPNIKFDFDSYDEFVSHPSLRNYVYERGIMPMSRLTMDRFWLNFTGGDSAAKKLRDHLNSDATSANDIGVDAVPGKPVAIILPAAIPKNDADIVLDFDEEILLDATSSLFNNNYRWQSDNITVSTASRLLFKAGKPSSRTQVVLEVQGDGGQISQDLRRIKIRNNKAATAQFSVAAIKEGSSKLVNLFALLCPQGAVDSKTCREIVGDIKKGEVPAIQLDQKITNGDVKIIDPLQGVVEFKSNRSFQMGSGAFTFSLIDSFAEASESINVTLPVEGYSAPVIVASHKCTVVALSVANENCENPALSDIAAEGLQLELYAVDAVSEQGGSASVSGGVLRYTPPPFFVGVDSFKYRVRDNSLSANSAEGKMDITVVPANVYSNVQAKVPSPLATLNEGEQVIVNLFEVLCPGSAVDSMACRSVFGVVKQGEYPLLNLGNNVNGVVTIIDDKTGVVKFISTASRLAGNGEFDFSLTDSFGQSTGQLKATVKVNSLPAPSIGADTCSISAKTTVNAGSFPINFGGFSCPDPIANDVAAPGLAINLDSVDSVSTKGGIVSMANGIISYTPPTNYVGADSFNYRIRDNSFTQKVSEGTVSITLSPKVQFSTISASIDATCPACHRVNTSILGPNWRLYSTFSSHVGGLGSVFMAYACGDPNHLGENRLCKVSLEGASPTSVDQLNSFGQTILTWIEEGGLNN